mmetsp:Transcript_21189/g.61638  ORF Transcript_21189/g.61638 Transcript_21189/m.61638 type:complete len:268 (+) Transcript_21189:895-1698(+)
MERLRSHTPSTTCSSSMTPICPLSSCCCLAAAAMFSALRISAVRRRRFQKLPLISPPPTPPLRPRMPPPLPSSGSHTHLHVSASLRGSGPPSSCAASADSAADRLLAVPSSTPLRKDDSALDALRYSSRAVAPANTESVCLPPLRPASSADLSSSSSSRAASSSALYRALCSRTRSTRVRRGLHSSSMDGRDSGEMWLTSSRWRRPPRDHTSKKACRCCCGGCGWLSSSMSEDSSAAVASAAVASALGSMLGSGSGRAAAEGRPARK